MSPDLLSVIVRSAGFVFLFQTAGAALFAALFASRLTASAGNVRRLAIGSAWAGIFFVGAHLWLDAARMSGEFAGMLDSSMLRLALSSSSAAAQAMQMAGLLVIASGSVSTRYGKVFGVLGALLAVSGFILTGHTSVHPWRVVLAPLLMLHLLIVAFWFGSLLPLWIVSQREPIALAATVLEKFSRLATWLVPLIALAGLIMAGIIARGVPPLAEPYGALLLTKLVAFAVLMGFAALNKWRLVPAMEVAQAQSLPALRRSMLAEFCLIVGVLAVTATMTTFFSPEAQATQ